MNWHYGFGTRRDRGLQLLRVEVEGRLIDIGEDRLGSSEKDRVDGRDKGEGARYNFIAGADAVRQHRQVQAGGAG